MEKLTEPQQRFLNEMAKTKSRDRNPNNRVALALHKKGLVSFALFVGWFVTPKGIAYVTHKKDNAHASTNR